MSTVRVSTVRVSTFALVVALLFSMPASSSGERGTFAGVGGRVDAVAGQYTAFQITCPTACRVRWIATTYPGLALRVLYRWRIGDPVAGLTVGTTRSASSTTPSDAVIERGHLLAVPTTDAPMDFAHYHRSTPWGPEVAIPAGKALTIWAGDANTELYLSAMVWTGSKRLGAATGRMAIAGVDDQSALAQNNFLALTADSTHDFLVNICFVGDHTASDTWGWRYMDRQTTEPPIDLSTVTACPIIFSDLGAATASCEYGYMSLIWPADGVVFPGDVPFDDPTNISINVDPTGECSPLAYLPAGRSLYVYTHESIQPATTWLFLTELRQQVE